MSSLFKVHPHRQQSSDQQVRGGAARAAAATATAASTDGPEPAEPGGAPDHWAQPAVPEATLWTAPDGWATQAKHARWVQV